MAKKTHGIKNICEKKLILYLPAGGRSLIRGHTPAAVHPGSDPAAVILLDPFAADPLP
jgi:ssDNA-binding Zn-finger/Zn-ribbon topoisomerase 1